MLAAARDLPAMPDHPVVFVSYSLEGDAHAAWVRRLATDLRTNGLDVILDQWALRVGDDVAAFMDDGVARADYLLLVCTESYAAKANDRRAGVGYEQGIITGRLLTDTASR